MPYGHIKVYFVHDMKEMVPKTPYFNVYPAKSYFPPGSNGRHNAYCRNEEGRKQP
jgi:hypothetical protein